MAFQSENIFINLSVKDLNRSTSFFKELGFEFNPQFSDETAACMIVSNHIFVMLMIEERFKGFTKREVVDTSSTSEAIFCLSAKNREQVDEMVNKALASGGSNYSDPQDHEFMYVWGYRDIDGHIWEIAYMDESAFNQE
ncbi:VOC family protein [Rummeliibacillus sp. JY-2-4R]